MMMRKKTSILKFALVFGLCLCVLTLFTGPGQAAEFKKEYKMTLNVGPKFYWGMGAQKFADLVKEKTKGQINIKPYWGSQLLKGAQLKSPQMVASGRNSGRKPHVAINAPILGCKRFNCQNI
jgi:TRAP-type C4-dicarboxylate transport system substrate-binding protein